MLNTNTEVNFNSSTTGKNNNFQYPSSGNVNQLFYNTSRNEELCKYAYLKFLYANGEKSNAIERMREFSANLIGQHQQFLQHQNQQQQQINMSQLSTPIVGGSISQQVQQPQMPNAFHMVNSREIQKRRGELEMLLSKCYLKLGNWSQEVGSPNIFTIEQIIGYYKLSRDHNNSSYKSWQAWAYANYEAIQFYKNNSISQTSSTLQLASQASSVPSSITQPIQQSIITPSLNSNPVSPQNSSSQNELNQQRIVYVKQAIKVFFIIILQMKAFLIKKYDKIWI